MILVGEKINGYIPRVARAMRERDAQFIQMLAKDQCCNGADYIDLCTGVPPEEDTRMMEWLIAVVQDMITVPLSIDSSNTETILNAMELTRRPGLVNAVSLDNDGRGEIFQSLRDGDMRWKTVIIASRARDAFETPESKLDAARQLIGEAHGHGIADERIFVDPFIATAYSVPASLAVLTSTIQQTKREFPDVHFISGLSNILSGDSNQAAIKAQFLAFAMAAGLDSVIADPTSAILNRTMLATQFLLGEAELSNEMDAHTLKVPVPIALKAHSGR